MLPLQLDVLGTLPGILSTLIIIALVLVVARIVMKVAWKLTFAAIVVVTVLWLFGLLGPLSGMFG